MFIFDSESLVMKKWQILEFDGKAYYAFVPENEEPFEADDGADWDALVPKEEILDDEYIYDDEFDESSLHEKPQDSDESEMEEIMLEPERKKARKHTYEVKLDAGVVTLEKLTSKSREENATRLVKRGNFPREISDCETSRLPDEALEDELVDEEDHRVVDNEATEIEREIGEENVFEDNEADMEQFTEREDEGSRVVSSDQSRLTVGPLKCKACSETFGSEIAFKKHVAWTHRKKVCIKEGGAYICSICDYRTLKKGLFASHLERKHETQARKQTLNVHFPCETCGFICRSKHSLQSHFIRKHTDKYEHGCEFCSKKFKVKGDLTNHVRFYHKEKPINCDICGKLCQNTGSLYVHRKWAHYKPKYECKICKRRMVTQENLDQHLLTQHEHREKTVCAQCGKTFTKKDSFKRHMAVHAGSKPHSCPICTKPFARQSQLRQHILIHTGQRPFVCDICGKAFTQKPGLICHRKTHPGPLPPLPVMPIADLVRDFIAQNEESQHQFDSE